MEKNYPVRLLPMDVVLDATAGETLLDVLAAHQTPLRADCGGTGRCGQCRVRMDTPEGASSLTETERDALTAAEVATHWRLACQVRVTGPVTVYIPPESLAGPEILGKTGLTGDFPADPAATRLILDPPFPDSSTGPYGDMVDWITAIAQAAGRPDMVVEAPEALNGLSGLAFQQKPITLVHHARRGATAVLAGRRPRSLGLAVDIGTTTVAAYLCDLRTGRVIGAAGAPNPQRRFGDDVISRICFANEHPTGLKTMQRLVVEAINDLLGRCLKSVDARREDVDEISVVGNTTMQQILGRLDLAGLGASPFLPIRRVIGDFRAGDLGLAVHPAVNVAMMPMISGFVGGDAMGAVLAEGPHRGADICLIVDIGTNGELVLGNRDGLWAASCATGPALEGACIEAGMAAAPGAIDRVRFDADREDFACHVIGDEASALAKGICGSGVIDAVAAMLDAGILNASGRIENGRPCVLDGEGGRRFLLAPPERSLSGRGVFVSQKDVRQVQLAKGALAAGIRLLLRHSGLERVDRLVLTGAFGARFDWRNAVRIGMLPEAATAGRVDVVENSAGIGAVMALLDQTRRREAQELLSRINVLELNTQPDFTEVFAASMAFPERGRGGDIERKNET